MNPSKINKSSEYDKEKLEKIARDLNNIRLKRLNVFGIIDPFSSVEFDGYDTPFKLRSEN